MTRKSHIVIDFDPSSAKKYVLQKYSIVVVDVLRATSTIIVALSQGAREAIPCVEIEDAEGLRETIHAILVGERKGEIIPGFDFTNSPHDLSKVKLTNQVIAITTSTGTKLINESQRSPNVLIGSTLNAQAIARKMFELSGNWAVLGAGTRGEFRPEDQVGCALIAKYYSKLVKCTINVYTKNIIKTFTKNVETHIRMSPSAQKLTEIEKGEDVDFVVNKLNTYSIVPSLQKNGEHLTITL